MAPLLATPIASTGGCGQEIATKERNGFGWLSRSADKNNDILFLTLPGILS